MRPKVVIIGGGVSGALCAVRLAERGFAVTLLEKAAIGNGSSSRSMAGIRAQFEVPATIVGMLYSEWFYANFHDGLATPMALRQPVIRQNGYLFLYDHPQAADAMPDAEVQWARAQRSADVQRGLGVAVELLEPDEIRCQWRHLRTERLVGATWCPTDGFLYPAVIYGEGVRRATELGACLVQRAEVFGARHAAGCITALETSRGLIETDYVVNCTNAWAPRVSSRLHGMGLPIQPTKRFLYHVDPGPAVLPKHVFERLPMTVYGMGRPLGSHTRPDGQHLILAGTSQLPPDREFSDDDQDLIPAAFDHRNGVSNFAFELLAEMALYAPTLAESAGVTATTSGYYAMTPDAVPLIGFDQIQTNLIHAAGFSGHGIMHAPITALLVEALLAHDAVGGQLHLPPPFDSHTLDLGAFDPRRDFARAEAESAVL